MANTKITNHIVDSTVITGQTAVTAADGDYILVADASDSNALKKVLASDLIQSSEEISDIVGAMVSSNTESGITVAYQDSDNTLDFTIGTLNQNTTGTAATVTGAAQTNITSLGTLTALTVDDITIDGSTITDGGTLTIDATDVVVQGQAAFAQISLKDNDGNTDGYVYAESGDVGFLDDDGHWAYKHDTDTSHQFQINNSERMLLQDSGPVLTITEAGSDGYEDMLKLVRTHASSTAAGLVFHLTGSGGTAQASSIYVEQTEDWSSGTSRSNTLSFQCKDDGTDQLMMAFGNFSDGVNEHRLYTEGAQRLTIKKDGEVGIGTATPNRTLSVSTGLAKTSTTTAYPFAIQSNESSGNAQLSVHATGGASAAVRKWIWQTEEAGVANNGIISFQPFGGKTQIGSSSGAYTFAEKLIVGDADANDGITIQSGTTHQGNVAFAKGGGTTADGRISYQHDSNYMEFLTNNTVRFRINSSGRYTYNGSGTANAHATFVGEVGSGFKALAFERTVGGGEVGTIVANSSSTTYNTSSDYRLKENVDYTWDATTRLKQLKPARFNWIADDTNTLLEGFLAHEVSSIVPEAVSGEKDAMADPILYQVGDELPSGKSVGDVKKASSPEYQGIDHSKLVPLLVKTIQELEARITTLEG